MTKVKEKKFIITGFYEFEERDSPKQQHGLLVVKGGADMKITQINEEE